MDEEFFAKFIEIDEDFDYGFYSLDGQKIEIVENGEVIEVFEMDYKFKDDGEFELFCLVWLEKNHYRYEQLPF